MKEESMIIRCARCGTKNRIPKNRLKDRPRCGKCQTPLAIDTIHDHPVDVTDDTFNREVLSHNGTVLVDCWAPWCGPCRMVSPMLEQLASEYAGRAKIVKLNVDENPRSASQFGIQSIPTLLFFKGGKQVQRLVGALPKAEIERHLISVL